ncbi:MAG: nucleoside triphosphate pyrophosphohydrolase [Chloroflexota bacterium]
MDLSDLDLTRFEALVTVIAQLRSPEGCPWDREQTHLSLRQNLLGECYEVLEALDRGSAPELCEELGDLLMQIVLHAQIAAEAGEFTIADVIKGINTKLISRHPHVFGDVSVRDTAEVLRNWQAIKQQEKGAEKSLLDSVPVALPSLAYSQEIQQRAAQAGFDWKDAGDIIDKLVEEVAELKEAESKQRQAEEFGDILFTLVNVARRMEIDPESALREAGGRFYRRFSAMEEMCRKRGQSFRDLSFDAQNELWEEVKEAEER